MAGATALDQRRGLVEPVEEAGACGVDVDDAGALGAEAAGNRGGEAGREPVGRDGRDDQVVDLGGFVAGVGERSGASGGGERGEAFSWFEAGRW